MPSTQLNETETKRVKTVLKLFWFLVSFHCVDGLSKYDLESRCEFNVPSTQ